MGDGLIQYLFLCTKPTEQEFFVPAQTPTELNSLTSTDGRMCQLFQALLPVKKSVKFCPLPMFDS